VHRIDPSLAVAEVRWMGEVADATVATPRFAFVLVGIFAGLAILLAAIGTYGVIAYSVSRRTPRIGQSGNLVHSRHLGLIAKKGAFRKGSLPSRASLESLWEG
jgi:hypothetical protein